MTKPRSWSRRATISGTLATPAARPLRVLRRVAVLVTTLCIGVGYADAVPQRSPPVPATRFSAIGVECHDGDTFTVRNEQGKEYEIRLFGVDAPELRQEFGPQSQRFMTGLVVRVSLQVFPSRVERNGRLVARVYVGGDDVGTLLLRSGLAWHSAEFSHDPVLADAERSARLAKHGLWSRRDPVPPWVFRRGSRRSDLNARRPSVDGPFHGNVSSFVFHARNCRDYRCKNCTLVFATTDDAVRAGFRPHSTCVL